MKKLFTNHWPIILIGCILLFIVGINLHPGKIILGNDNFSPELNPGLTINRSFFNPAWRDNRVLGIPSDSEQADVWRSIIFWIGKLILPTWIVSQGYLFLTIAIGVLSMGKVIQLLTNNSKSSQFFGSLLYLFSPITVWIYFYPVQLFVAAYALTPLVLWFLLRVINNPSRKNKIFLLISSLIMGTTALTATMFITCTLTILSISLFSIKIPKKQLKNWLLSTLIYLLPQLFWLIPFATYVYHNNQDLQNSSINREITATTSESEQSNNTIWNTLRFSSTWMDTKENDLTYTYPSRDWFKNNTIGIYLGYLPVILAILGLLSVFTKRNNNRHLLLISIVGISGLIFLNGNNPPFNHIYTFFDKNIPLFHQVFRWGSSKFWPLLLFPLLILAVKGIETLRTTKSTLFKHSFTLIISLLIIYSVHPIITSKLIRNEVFVNIPPAYSALTNELSYNLDLIDTTPHTNTRYFRRNDWGFWGSVFLNYLLPNPTTEKALIIGSAENETAFNVIDESYYSENQDTYINSITRFRIPYVLSDRSVTNQGLGLSYSFPYDWQLQDHIISSNNNLEKVWSQDPLSLFVNKQAPSTDVLSIIPNHNYEYLDKSLALQNIHSNYVTMEDEGSIFPLNLIPSEIFSTESNILLLNQLDIAGNYHLFIPATTLTDLPLIAYIQNNQLIISPYYPSITVNNQPLYSPPTTITPLAQGFNITIDNQIINNIPHLITSDQLSKTQIWTQNTKPATLNELAPTPCNQKANDPDNQACLSTDINITKPSLISLTSTISAIKPTLVDICLHSLLENACLNSPQTYLATNDSQTFTVFANNIVKPNDNLVIFFVLKTSDQTKPSINISNQIIINTLSNTINTTAPDFKDLDLNFALTQNDSLAIVLPIISYIPKLQIFQAFCPDRGQTNQIERINTQYILTSANCFDGFYGSFSLPDYLSATGLLTYIKATNIQGVPLEYNLKQDQVDRKLSTDLLSNNTTQNFLKYTLLPASNQNFTVELINKGIGKTPTVNSLISYASLPIPNSWLNLKFTPSQPKPTMYLSSLTPYIPRNNTGTFIAKIDSSTSLYTLPTADSPYWKAVILKTKPSNLLSFYIQVLIKHPNLEKSLVNGWQPAWKINENNQDQYLAVIFLPNVLAYLGLFLGLGTALYLCFRQKQSPKIRLH